MKKYISVVSYVLLAVACILLAVAVASAQTRVTIKQMKATVTGLLLGMSDNSFQAVKIGSGLQIVTPTGATQPELQVTATSNKPMMFVAGAGVNIGTDGSLSVVDAACCITISTLQVYRNGVRQKLGTDYTVAAITNGVSIVPIGLWGLDISDVLQVDYIRQ